MDEMKLTSRFMRGVVSKIFEKLVKEKTGYNAKFKVNDVHIVNMPDKANVHLDIDATLSREELVKILKKFNL